MTVPSPLDGVAAPPLGPPLGTTYQPVVALNETMPWFGAHTGYGQLVPALRGASVALTEISPRPGRWPRLVGKAYALLRGLPARNQAVTAAELELLWRWRPDQAVAHILYAEGHGSFFTRWRRAPRSLVVTLHQPPAQWTADALDAIRPLQSALVLCRRDLAFFEGILGKGRVQVVRHGVDVAFFAPDGTPPSAPRRLLFVGVWLRNTGMLARVVRRLADASPDLRFDLVVPEHGRGDPDLQSLADHPSVAWHAALADDELRRLYRRSYLSLMPMNASMANNAIVEALACGLPVVTTDVGGIRDYGGGEVFPLVANDDDDAMVSLVTRYLDHPAWRDEIGQAARRFAEERLAWPVIARAHLEAYRALVDG